MAAKCVLALAGQCRAGLLLFRGLEPQRRWRTSATALLDVAARCGVQRIVSLGAMLADLPHTRPPRVTGSSTDPHWHAQFEAWGIARRSRYEGPTGIASVLLAAARRRGLASLTLMGQAPHYLQGTTNPAMRQALLRRYRRTSPDAVPPWGQRHQDPCVVWRTPGTTVHQRTKAVG